MQAHRAGFIAGGVLFAGLLWMTGCQKGSSPGHESQSAGHAGSGGTEMAESGKTAVATFEVRGMHCSGCVNAIQEALAEKDGVVEKTVSLEDSVAVVTYDPAKLAPADLVALIEELGYTAVEKR